MKQRFASVALWLSYLLLVLLVAVQMWATEAAFDRLVNLECNLAVVSLVENSPGLVEDGVPIRLVTEVSAALIEEVCLEHLPIEEGSLLEVDE